MRVSVVACRCFLCFISNLVIFLLKYLFSCLCVCANVYCVWVPKEVRREHPIPCSWSCELPMWMLEIQLGPLEGQEELLTAKLSVHPLSFIFFIF